MSILAGVDIGGTKCAVSLGKQSGSGIEVIGKKKFPTPSSPELAIEGLIQSLAELLNEYNVEVPAAIGISCGGPLDSQRGVILSPPNLPGWDEISIIAPLKERFGVQVALQNDANACAIAEWKWGAGKGCRNMVFLTFGTGMGAGLILDGKLYSGTNDMAGEVGHMRLEKDGPVGYGKAGSFEGFCSGGGMARLAQIMAEKSLKTGTPVSICPTLNDVNAITAKMVGDAARQGDSFALEVVGIVGKQLGRGLSVLVDILNPERIVIGSIYARDHALLEPIVLEELKKEALPHSMRVCQIVPAGLGESVGDLASLSVALYTLEG